MIVTKANPGRSQEIFFTGSTPVEREMETTVWRGIAPLVDRLDRKLRQLNQQVLAGLDAKEAT